MTNLDRLSMCLLLPLAALTLVSCGKSEDQAPPSVKSSAAPLPPIPAWAAPLLGKNIDTAFTASTTCKGHFDNVIARSTASPAGVVVLGWAWDTAAAKPVDHVLLADSAAMIVGAASGGVKRPDVPAALPDVTSQTTGWEGPVRATTGEITAYALLNATTACKISTLGIDSTE